MKLEIIYSKERIIKFLSGVNQANWVYQCCNLEYPFWEQTKYLGLCQDQAIKALAIFIERYEIPVLIACTCSETDTLQKVFLGKLVDLMPERVYCHLDKGASERFKDSFEIESCCDYMNMELQNESENTFITDTDVVKLTVRDRNEIFELLKVSHPDNFFDEEFLLKGYFKGIFKDERLICVGGVTAVSDHFGLVSVGTLTTHPEYRRKGFSKRLLRSLIQDLKIEYKRIMLNVKIGNIGAVNCYRNLGFRETGIFQEIIMSRQVRQS